MVKTDNNPSIVLGFSQRPICSGDSVSSDAERLARVLAATRAIAWECDLATRMVSFQAAPELLLPLGISTSLPARDVLQRVHPDDRDQVLNRARSAIEHREPYTQHFRLLADATVEPLWLELRATVSDVEGVPTWFTGVATDITSHRRAVEALTAEDRRKNDFLATVAHELRNPVSAMLTATEVLQSEAISAEQRKRLLDTIVRQAAQLTRLAEDLFDLSRGERDHLDLVLVQMDLRSAVHQALESTEALIRSRAHHVTLTLPPEAIMVRADPGRMAQVFTNLLANAARYTHTCGRIEVCVERTEHAATVRVRDSGIGIAPDVLPHVFEPFFQGGQTAGLARDGLGIGLALVQRIVRLHGGSVSVFSAGAGHGSEFTVQLPYSRE